MDIQQYIAADKELLLNLNGSQSLFWDGFMWVATSTIVWVPVAAMLLYIIIKNNKIQEALLTIVMIALVITLADQIASGLCKPFFARFRPTQDPNIMYMVDIDLIYLLYKFIQKKIFYKPRCISNQYTASGYLISDINLFYIILISTYFFIIIAGMIVTHTLNL
ncbi:hypothetical protein Q4460_15475 [Phocaeicola vulgatus]|uniref:hypothetical protein n=1 Tax=Phocaeicola vulgatus TaxID=821 RepID=UPI0026E16274|nr:hypothetical protein [Phocaeicola vulgatus]MDO6219090.1 hypothetical protein [Phocaeicola vulgatus]